MFYQNVHVTCPLSTGDASLVLAVLVLFIDMTPMTSKLMGYTYNIFNSFFFSVQYYIVLQYNKDYKRNENIN